MEQVEARIEVVALAHLPEIDDVEERLESIFLRLPEFGEAELQAQWASMRDESRNLDRLHGQQEQLTQGSRENADA